MKIDRIQLEGTCSGCGGQIEVDTQPEKQFLPMMASVVKRCTNKDCRISFLVHVQEIKPLF